MHVIDSPIGTAGAEAHVVQITQLPKKSEHRHSLSVVALSTSSPNKFLQACVSYTGKNCSSCVGKVIAGIAAKPPWARSVDVSLLNHSAFVRFEGGRKPINYLVKLIKFSSSSTVCSLL